MKVCVIGLGEIGEQVLKEVSKKFETVGIDINPDKVKKLKKQGYDTFDTFQNLSGICGIYIICVYTNQQVLDVIGKIDYSNRPLIIIESTISPESLNYLEIFIIKKNKSNLVVSPHRYYAGDKDYGIFNQTRVIAGASNDCLQLGLSFYQNFMKKEDLVETDLKHAAYSKLLENAYRFVEIAIAEELKMQCDSLGLDFSELRKCANSKWNIDIKEARDGIGGKCLPKDVDALNGLFKDNFLFDSAIKADKKYKDER